MRRRTRAASFAAFTALVVQALAPAVRAADALDGWTIQRLSATDCLGKHSDGNTLIAAVGPQFSLLVRSPSFPATAKPYTVGLSFDGKRPVQAAALGGAGLLDIQLWRGEAALMVAGASYVVVEVEGRTSGFSLENAGAALDAVARCAGQRTLAEEHDEIPMPIPGGGDWKLTTTLPGIQRRVCTVRITGEQVNTTLALNDVGALIVIAGHSDWRSRAGLVPLQLAIDGTPPVALQALSTDTIITLWVPDPALRERLRNARTLEWTTPERRVRGDVTGLGAALDTLVACTAKLSAN